MDSAPIHIFFEKLSPFENASENQKDILSSLARELFPNAAYVQEASTFSSKDSAPEKLEDEDEPSANRSARMQPKNYLFACQSCILPPFAATVDKSTVQTVQISEGRQKVQFQLLSQSTSDVHRFAGNQIRWSIEIKKVTKRFQALALRDLGKGEVFSEGAFSLKSCYSPGSCNEKSSFSAQAAAQKTIQKSLGMQFLRPIKQNQSLGSADFETHLSPLLVVTRGDLLKVKLQNAGGDLVIETQGKALESGSLNAVIKFELSGFPGANPKPRTLIGKVTGSQEVSFEN